jgi:hypothetical protein
MEFDNSPNEGDSYRFMHCYICFYILKTDHFMKKLIIFAFAVSSIAAKAQPAASVHDDNKNPATTSAAPSKIVYASPYSLDYTTMTVDGNNLSFENLPQQGSLTLYITDSKGNEMMSQKLYSKRNTTNIARLKDGMYFVTLISENTTARKSFTLSKGS